MHETKETVGAVFFAACLVAGIGAVAYYTVGPDGWFLGLLNTLLRDPNLGTLASLALVIGATIGVKRWLDRRQASSIFDNLLVGAIALGGFAFILQGLQSLVV